MAFFLYMLMFLVLSEAARFIFILKGNKAANINLYTTGTALCLCVLFIFFGIFHARSIKTVDYNISMQGSGGGIRIVLLSDLHIGSLVNEAWTGRVVEKINKQKPDIVLIAGDIFDGNIDVIRDLQGVITNLGSINAPLGAYACLGNHDVDRQALRGGTTKRIEGILKEAGITLLQDEVVIIRDNLYLGGRRDARPIGLSNERKTSAEMTEGINGTILMMDHQPVQFPQLEKAGVSLVVSGHTHKGQLFPASLFTYLIFKRAGASHYGYWKGETMQAVVTSGAGLWGPPLRIGTNSEIAVINIEFMQ
ncbi:MAG: metallophosphoesterase [Treponema sp.]|nr:metallophosphoesterase [Treponema sp.]MCL2272019.1 metallophosphoesterase [Treponema sp.]